MKVKRQFQRARRPARRQKKASGPSVNAVYGWHSALAALQNPERRIERILATENALARLADEPLAPGIADRLPQPVPAAEIERLVGADAVHQGLAVVCAPLPERTIEDIAGSDLILVLDQVTDPHNVGAILRSAAAFGAGGLVMSERHGAAERGVLAKTASGGLEHVPLVRVTNLARALREIADHGFIIYGLDSAYAEPIESVPPSEKAALVLGAEGRGLRRLTREACDHLVRLDMPGAIKSLNVSNAAAVALYALTRKN
jgi:23S rRNA (guanosine2251-2'-O)-methyltransferase